MAAGSMTMRSPTWRDQIWNNHTWRNQNEKQAFDPPRAKPRVLLPLARAWLLIPRPSSRAFLQKRAKQSLLLRLKGMGFA
jgi:hypothetical protein